MKCKKEENLLNCPVIIFATTKGYAVSVLPVIGQEVICRLVFEARADYMSLVKQVLKVEIWGDKNHFWFEMFRNYPNLT
jgi:hypothetical protein